MQKVRKEMEKRKMPIQKKRIVKSKRIRVISNRKYFRCRTPTGRQQARGPHIEPLPSMAIHGRLPPATPRHHLPLLQHACLPHSACMLATRLLFYYAPCHTFSHPAGGMAWHCSHPALRRSMKYNEMKMKEKKNEEESIEEGESERK